MRRQLQQQLLLLQQVLQQQEITISLHAGKRCSELLQRIGYKSV